MKRHLFAGLVCLGFAGAAGAQGPEDVTAILENLQPAVEDLVAGLQDTATTLADTQSAVATSAALGNTVVNTGSTLVQDTEFSALSLALAVNNNSIQGLAEPYLTLIDDPSAENFEAAFDPNDLSTIAGNLENVPDAALEGSGFGPNGSGLRAAAIEALRGNLGDIGGGALIYGVGGVIFPTQELFADTSFDPEVGQIAAINGLALVLGGEPLWAELRGPVSDLGEAGAPVTEPVIDVLAGL